MGYSPSVMAARGQADRPLATTRDVIQPRHSPLLPRLASRACRGYPQLVVTSARLRSAGGFLFRRMSARPLLPCEGGVSGPVRLAGAAAVPGLVAGQPGREQQPRDGQAAVTPGRRCGRPVRRSPPGLAAGPAPGPGTAREHGRGPRRPGVMPRRGPRRPARRAAGPGAARRPPWPGPPGSRSARP